MDEQFSIYKDPFSDETKRIRRNLLIVSGLCLFIGISEALPNKLSLIGLTFSPDQQVILGWFIFSVMVYKSSHFGSRGSLEIAFWVQPLLAEGSNGKCYQI